MYLEHFGFERMPFECLSSGSVYVDMAGHREALNTVLFGLRSGEGFIKVVGEVGTGKTALCRSLLARLDSGALTVYLPNPALRPRDLMLAIADELGVRLSPRAGTYQLQKKIREILLDIANRGDRVVILVDEAQTMPSGALEELRLLSNLEARLRKLVQVVLFGQPELDEKLARYSLRQLQQRIAFSARLEPLCRNDCRLYIHKRLIQSGACSSALFTPAACHRIHRESSGIPRLINILCHKSLIAAFTAGDLQVQRKHVARAVHDTEGIRRWRRRPFFSPKMAMRVSSIDAAQNWRSFQG